MKPNQYQITIPENCGGVTRHWGLRAGITAPRTPLHWPVVRTALSHLSPQWLQHRVTKGCLSKGLHFFYEYYDMQSTLNYHGYTFREHLANLNVYKLPV